MVSFRTLVVSSLVASFVAQAPVWAQNPVIGVATNAISTPDAPTVDSVEPPDWWAGHTINPVRLLIYGHNLGGADVVPVGSGLSTSREHVSAAGTYLFVDLKIDASNRPGARTLKIVTPHGSTTAEFDIAPSLPPAGRFQGFSPDDVVYLIMPDRFSDGDPSNDDPAISRGLYNRADPHKYHGGDFQGIINHLSYLKDLGVTAIWITPIYDNDNKVNADYHGYGAIDFYKVEEHFGTMAKLRELVDRAHALGLKVIQDQVANHTGQNHPWNSDPPTPTWYNGTKDNHLDDTWQIWTVTDPHATPQLQASTVNGWFVNLLPDVNQNDPDAAQYEIQNTLWWLGSAGFDGIREDTFSYVPRSFWSKWNAAIKAQYPTVNAVGEVYNGDPGIVAFFQGGRKQADGIDTGIDSLFDFPVYYAIRDVFAHGKAIGAIPTQEAHDWMYVNAGHLMTYLGSHDMSRFASEDGATTAGLELAQTFLLTNRGIPMLYYGDEIGMLGGNDPDNRRDFPGGFPGDSRDAFSAAGRTPQEQEIFEHVRTLNYLRAAIEPLRRGDQKTLYLYGQQWVYARIQGSDFAIVALNNDTSPATFTFPVYPLNLRDGTSLTDKLAGLGTVQVANGSVTLTLPARTGAILTR